MKTSDGWDVPTEYLELQFTMKDGDHFTIDAEKVEVDTAEASGKFRGDTVKRWHLEDGDLERDITADEVYSVMPVVKDEYRDEVYDDDNDNLPAPQ